MAVTLPTVFGGTPKQDALDIAIGRAPLEQDLWDDISRKQSFVFANRRSTLLNQRFQMLTGGGIDTTIPSVSFLVVLEVSSNSSLWTPDAFSADSDIEVGAYFQAGGGAGTNTANVEFNIDGNVINLQRTVSQGLGWTDGTLTTVDKLLTSSVNMTIRIKSDFTDTTCHLEQVAAYWKPLTVIS